MYFQDLKQLKSVILNYIEMPGWEQDLTKMSEVSQLPENLMNYINYLEEVLEVPIKIVSVGPDRTQTIHR